MSEEQVNEAEKYFVEARTLAYHLAEKYNGQNKEVVVRVLTAGIARNNALQTLKGLDETTDAELVRIPKQVIESAKLQLGNYGSDVCKKAAELCNAQKRSRQYGLTAENLTARGHGIYVAKEQGRSAKWQDTRRGRKVAEVASIADAVLT